MKKFLVLSLCLLVSACQQAVTPTTGSAVTPTPGSTQTRVSTRTATTPPTPTAQLPTATAAPVPFQVCSPLEGETFDTLPLILVNPLKIPPIGKDDGHHGLDFAYYQRGDIESIQGIEIYAILPGVTVLTLEDNIPYGYTILIETPLNQLPQTLQDKILETYLPIPEDLVYQGECPEITPPGNTEEMSVYHLYAHMEAPPAFQTGDPITCGQKLGTVGNSGHSSNPHLHLETRLGPSGANISDMAFYSPAYSVEQRANYCLWRMSGYYQLFDPFLLLSASQ